MTVPIKLAIQFYVKKEVLLAVSRGELIKPEQCFGCNNVRRLDGHHPDYRKPLEVVWLCRRCHKEIHCPNARKNRLKRKKQKQANKLAKEKREERQFNKSMRGFPTDGETLEQIEKDREYLIRRIINRNSIGGCGHITNFYKNLEEEKLINELVNRYAIT